MRLTAITLACRTLLWGAQLRWAPDHVLGLQLHHRADTIRTLEYAPPGVRGMLIHESTFIE
jgi:hypothetical protein